MSFSLLCPLYDSFSFSIPFSLTEITQRAVVLFEMLPKIITRPGHAGGLHDVTDEAGVIDIMNGRCLS